MPELLMAVWNILYQNCDTHRTFLKVTQKLPFRCVPVGSTGIFNPIGVYALIQEVKIAHAQFKIYINK